MADLGGVFDAVVGGFLPDRLKLDEVGFKAAFEAQRLRDEAAGTKLTFESYCSEVGISERVLRRARSGQATLPRHQVLAMAARLGCVPGNFVTAFPASVAAWNERGRRELAAWPVPLRLVRSWVELTNHLARADVVKTLWRDEALSLAAAPALDAFRERVTYAQKVAQANPAMAAASLQDAAGDLAPHGLHPLLGRYVGRRSLGDGYIGMVYVLEMWVQPRTGDLLHVVDRGDEPLATSDAEGGHDGDVDVEAIWLEWEGKPRLALWPS